jgi:tetraprenyl-beta-curcumene synthase
MAGHIWTRIGLTRTFAHTASSYWLDVFPEVARELRLWRGLAASIPDPVLRRLALSTHQSERGNLEGAAAFAVLAPREHRSRVVRATVAFQAIYDYIDTLAEQPCVDPVANGRQLHLALLTALDPASEHSDYYLHHATRADGGYLARLIDHCRGALAELPSCREIVPPALRAARRMIGYQALNHGRWQEGRALEHWAHGLLPPARGLRWWESAAGAASSLTVFAMMSAAAAPSLPTAQIEAMEKAYFPWIGALHVLLDSLVDRAADAREGQHSLVDHYASPEEAATRLHWITHRALDATRALPESATHALILAAMASFYLCAPGATVPAVSPASRRVLHAMGALAAPTMGVLRVRRAAARLLAPHREAG